MKIKFIFKDEVVDFCIKPETFVQIKLAKGAKGENGKDGKDGQDGYTPVKGVDYFTEADKEELLSGVEQDISDLETNKADKSEIPDVSDYVKNTDYATGSKAGVMKTSSAYGVNISGSNGNLMGIVKSNEEYNSGYNAMFISKGTLENVITGKQLINQTTLDDSQAEQNTDIQANTDNITALLEKIDYIEGLIPTGEASGESLTLTDSARYPFKEFNVSGNSVQNGDPTPETPVPVENVSGGAEVKVENKNLAYISSKIDWRYSSTLENGDLKINGTSSDAGNILIKINGGNGLILKPNKTYILSVIMEGTVSGGQYKNIYLKGSSIGTLASNTTRTHKITPTEDYKLEDINLDLAPNITFTNFTIKIQVEEGSTATSYEPHEEQTATFPLAEGQVLHLGDTLEDDGIHQRRFTRVFDGTETTWIKNSLAFEFSLELIIKKSAQTIGLSSHFIQSFSWSSSNAAYRGKFQIDYIYNKFKLMPTDESITTIDLWKAYLAEQYSNGKPVTIEYELETEIIIPYTQEQQEAYDKIKDLYSYKGTTHISSSNEPSPVFEVVYRKSLG